MSGIFNKSSVFNRLVQIFGIRLVFVHIVSGDGIVYDK
jgi:hypothetical protein